MARFFFGARRIRDNEVQRNFEQLEGYLHKLGIADFGFGTFTATFTASANSATATVSHGMSTAPSVVIVGGAYRSGVVTVDGFVREGSADADSFDAYGAVPGGGAWTGSISLPWIALA